jgi:hypothetical protein
MITSTANAASHLRSAQASPSMTTLTRADALPDTASADQSTATANQNQGIPVSAVKKLDMSGLKLVSLADDPEFRDRLATAWLDMHAVPSTTDVPDNALQNTYATVKVNGKIVATLYNSGSSAMTNEAVAKVGSFQDPPGLTGGPDLAQWRAERIAEATGGTIETASTAITQSEWTPRPTVSKSYTRAQLDGASEAMKHDRAPIAQPRSYYLASRDTSGTRADFSA